MHEKPCIQKSNKGGNINMIATRASHVAVTTAHQTIH